MTNDRLKITIGVLAAIFVVLIITLAVQTGSSVKDKQVVTGPTAVGFRTTSTTGFVVSSPVSPPNSFSVTSTRIPTLVSTATSAVPAATRTAVPTPTATPDLNTPTGAILVPDQKWVKDGVILTLVTDPKWFTPGGIEGWGDCWRQPQDLKFYVRVKNSTSQPIFFDVGKGNYVVSTSTRRTLSITEYDLCTSIGSMSIGPGIETVHTNGPRFSGEGVGDLRVSVLGEYTGSDVSYIDIQLVNFSRVQLATWRVPINH